MRQLTRWLSVALLLGLVLLLGRTGLLASLDDGLQDWRLSMTSRPVSGDTVFVAVDSKSLAEVGTWPWPRSLYGRVLDRLMDAGADEVAFDIDFSSSSTPAEDAAFAAALERAGGFAVLAAFVQDTGADGLMVSRPLPQFTQWADPVLVNVLIDGNAGHARWVPKSASDGSGPMEALAARLGQPTTTLPDLVTIDYSLDLSGIPRFSFTDVLDGHVAPELLAGKKVIVGASAIELRDFFHVPRYGIISGPLVQALAAETVRTGRIIRDFSGLPGLGLVAALALVILALGRPPIRVAGAVLLATALLGEVLAVYAYGRWGVLVDTAAMHLGLVGLFALVVADDGYAQLLGRRQAMQRLGFLATHDAQTGLLSRHGFVSAAASGPSEELVVLQLLHMDELRATLGHDVADAVLTQFAHKLSSLNGNGPALVGEQSFAAARPDKGDASGLRLWAEMLSDSMSGVYHVPGHSVYIDVVAGYAAGPFVRSALLVQAETALLRARSERARVRGYIVADQEALERRRRLERDLRDALHNQDLHLAYQPQVDLRSRRLTGAEALVRWQHPELGMISPAEFIPLAEETGLIVDLGGWVLRQACRDAAGWPLPLKVSVNVSPIQFDRMNMEAEAKAALADADLPPHRLELEITEGARMANALAVNATLTALSQLGIALAVDDFGTGYSSLSYFQELPFDTLKIDQQFVRGRDSGQQSAALLAAIVELALRLDKHIVAEGVEDEATAELLAQLGCHTGQGYYFSRPIPPDAFIALMTREAVPAVGHL